MADMLAHVAPAAAARGAAARLSAVTATAVDDGVVTPYVLMNVLVV